MTATLRAIAISLALIALGAGRQTAQAGPPFQERLPGFEGYCPLVVRPGDLVTLRVSVANASPETARGTLTEIRVPAGLVLDEGSVRVVPGPGATRFMARAAAHAAAGTALAATDANDVWQSYTLIVVAQVADTAIGEQLAVSLARDSAGRLIRRVDGVVHAQSGGRRALSASIVIDMGVPEVCKAEPTRTPTPTATATPTPTPPPPPYYVSSLALTDIEGAPFSLAVVCVLDPGQQVNRPPAAQYQIAFELMANARVALAFGASPSIAGDGRSARFLVPSGGSAVRVAIASRPAADQPVLRAAIAPGIRVSADGFGVLAERSVEAGANCAADPAMVAALVSAERASRTARALANVGAAEVTIEPSASAPVATPQPASSVAPTATRGATSTPGASAPTGVPPSAISELPPSEILPDPRSIMLPLAWGGGVALASLALAFFARRRGGDD